MPQTFSPQAELLVKLLCLGTVAAVIALGVVLWARASTVRRLDVPVAQPIPFSHQHHVGDDGLDCRMCHATVERAATPGMPSAQVCLGCHAQLFADQRMFEPLRQAAATGQPIAWNTVHRLPDYVFFDHSVHVAKQVPCAECHGRVDQMPLMAPVAPLTMRWCLSCHESPVSHLHEQADEFAMPPAPVAPARQAAIAQAVGLEPHRRLVDCSTCHR